MSEILIATKGSNLGMAGPAMIEGGGLGVYDPRDIGPVEEQAAIGVIDILAEDEADATRLAKQALELYSRPAADLRGHRSTSASPRRAGEPAAGLRRAGRDRDSVRYVTAFWNCAAPSRPA